VRPAFTVRLSSDPGEHLAARPSPSYRRRVRIIQAPRRTPQDHSAEKLPLSTRNLRSPRHSPAIHAIHNRPDRGAPFDKLRVTEYADYHEVLIVAPPKPCHDAHATILPGRAAEDGAAAGRFGVAKARKAESDGEPSDQSAGCASGASPLQHRPPLHTPPQTQKNEQARQSRPSFPVRLRSARESICARPR
jgi:hypothetical protein